MLKIAIELFTTTFTIASALKPVSANVERETSKKKKKKKEEEEEETRRKKKQTTAFPLEADHPRA